MYEEWAEHYENGKLHLKKDVGNHFGYHFSDEDFYVYLLTHGYKHYSSSGTGVRFLSDIFVFIREKKTLLDWEYIANELQTLKLYEFEAATRELAEKLFGSDEYTLADEEGKRLAYLMGAGTYGLTEIRVNRELEMLQQDGGRVTGWTKFRYICIRLFPDKRCMQGYHSFCRKHAWSIPFFWVYRLLKAVTSRGKAIRSELHTINKAE